MSKYLKFKREQVGLTQKDISKALKYSSPQFISNIERGIALPSEKDLKKYAELLKVDLQEFKEIYIQASMKRFTDKLIKRMGRIK